MRVTYLSPPRPLAPPSLSPLASRCSTHIHVLRHESRRLLALTSRIAARRSRVRRAKQGSDQHYFWRHLSSRVCLVSSPTHELVLSPLKCGACRVTNYQSEVDIMPFRVSVTSSWELAGQDRLRQQLESEREQKFTRTRTHASFFLAIATKHQTTVYIHTS